MDNQNNLLVDLLRVEGVNAKGYGTVPKAVMKEGRLTLTAKAIYAYFCSYRRLKPRKQNKFRLKHETELLKFESAERYLKQYISGGALPIREWKEEHRKLGDSNGQPVSEVLQDTGENAGGGSGTAYRANDNATTQKGKSHPQE